MPDAPPSQSDRSLAIDAVKGVGILEVVLHHGLGQGARLYATKGDVTWTVMRATAWLTNFAIPLFLLLSAMLLAGSFAKSADVPRFVWRRVSRSLWPYLVWTGIYWLLRLYHNPDALRDTGRLVTELLTGKASYHLYFMVILLQLSVAVPFVVLALRGRHMGFGVVLLLAAALQLGLFFLNRVPLLRVHYPGSTLTWYVTPLILGVWIALDRDRWATAWARWWPALAGVGLAAGVAFAVLSIRAELKLPIDSVVYNSTSVLFRTSASLALLGAAAPLAKGYAGPFLAALGRFSLAIYLVHPAILSLFAGPKISEAIARLPFPALWPIVAVTATSYVFAWTMSLLRLDSILFGQRLPQRASTAS